MQRTITLTAVPPFLKDKLSTLLLSLKNISIKWFHNLPILSFSPNNSSLCESASTTCL
ncbi:MAG: hypothetical protein IJX17_02880 [Clostridia bacterium]|nr:hypothetical protein [Clostridia bacterium]